MTTDFDTSGLRADRPLDTAGLRRLRDHIREALASWDTRVSRWWARASASETAITDVRPYVSPGRPLAFEPVPVWIHPGADQIECAVWYHVGGSLEAGLGTAHLALRLVTVFRTFVVEVPISSTIGDEWTVEDVILPIALPGLTAPTLGALTVEIRTEYDDTISGLSEVLNPRDDPTPPVATRIQILPLSAGGTDDFYLDPRAGATYPDPADASGDVWVTVTRITHVALGDVDEVCGHVASQALQFDPNANGMRIWPRVDTLEAPTRVGIPDELTATLIASSYVQIGGLELAIRYDADEVVSRLELADTYPGAPASGELGVDLASSVVELLSRRVLLAFGQEGHETGAAWSTRSYRRAWGVVEGAGSITSRSALKRLAHVPAVVSVELILLGAWFDLFATEVESGEAALESGVVGAVTAVATLYQRQAGILVDVGQATKVLEVTHVPTDSSGRVHFSFVELVMRRQQPTAWDESLSQHEGTLDMGQGEAEGSDTALVLAGLRTLEVVPNGSYQAGLATECELVLTPTSGDVSGTTYPYLAKGGATDARNVRLERMKLYLAGQSIWALPGVDT